MYEDYTVVYQQKIQAQPSKVIQWLLEVIMVVCIYNVYIYMYIMYIYIYVCVCIFTVYRCPVSLCIHIYMYSVLLIMLFIVDYIIDIYKCIIELIFEQAKNVCKIVLSDYWHVHLKKGILSNECQDDFIINCMEFLKTVCK